MRLSAKHEQRTVTYGNFTGGLNNTSVPEQIAENQLAECINMEFNRATGALETCCGTAMVFKAPTEVSVDWITYDGINNKFIFADLRTRKLYKTSLVDMTGTVANDCEFIGTLTGNLKPKSVQWEDGTLIASGGKLQYWNGSILKTLGSVFTDYSSKWDYIGRVVWYWHVQTRYAVGAVVRLRGKVYYCTTAHLSTYSFDPSKWAEGRELPWDNESRFKQYDVIKYQDEYYVCNEDHITGKGAPLVCNGVFVKNGRVWVWYDYTLQCSAVGDEENWKYDTTDDSSSKYIDVGYKDGENEHGFIVGVSALSSALVILKNNGVVYKLTGDYPDWSLNEIARGIKPLNPESYIGTPNGVLIVGKSGMYMLETTDEYGDIKPANLASNIIGMFCLLTMDNTVVRFLPNLNQVWITGLTNSVIVYSLDFKVFFERQFNNTVSDVTTNTTEVFIARKDKVTRLTKGIYEDEKYSDDEAPMSWSFQAKSLLSFYDILVKRFRVSYVPLMDEFDRAEILIGDEKLVLGMPDRISDSPLIFTNTTLIYNDLGFIFETMTQFNTTWAVYRKRVVDVKGKGYGSAISLNSIEIAVAEV